MAIGEAPTQATGMSIEEFIRLFDAEGPFELVDGQRVVYMPTRMFGNIRLANRIVFAINSFSIPGNSGEAFVEGTFILPDLNRQNWVKGSCIPDVMYVCAERYEQYRLANPEWETTPLALVPDFIIEIISEHDNYVDVLKKVSDYLRDGVRLIWLIEPQMRIVTTYTDSITRPLTFTFEDELSLGDLLPGFTIRLSDL